MKKLKSEIRKDYLENNQVIITPSRAKRPKDIKQNEKTVVDNTNCPFCEKNLNKNNVVDRLPKKGKWETLSLNNVFPAVTLDNPKAYGAQEVIVETPEHNVELASLSLSHIQNILKLYQKRTMALAKNKKINYVLIFKNQGPSAGASLLHAHSQIFATDVTPKKLAKEEELSKKYFKKNNSCIYCNIIKKELKSPRKILENKYFAIIAPYASQYHYEAWILPKRHVDNISLLNKQEIISLSKNLKFILKKIQKLGLDYNFFLHNVISNTNQHFYIKIQPRGNVWAGVEMGSGIIINSTSPEAAAKYYKK
jgi:UDPglucose--hexose-1-phosphate uridylyltransferase